MSPATRPWSAGNAGLRRHGPQLASGLLLALVVILGTAWVALPRLVAAGARMEAARVLGAQGAVSLQLHPASVPALLGGRLGAVSLQADGAHLGGLAVQRLEASASRVDVDLGALLRGRRLSASAVRGLTVRLQIGEQALNDYLRRNLPAAQQLHLSLGAGTATLTSQAVYAGHTFHVQAQGRFVAQNGRAAYNVDQLTVDGVPVPAGLRAQLLAFLGSDALSVDLSGESLPLRVQSVATEPGMLTVEATGQ